MKSFSVLVFVASSFFLTSGQTSSGTPAGPSSQTSARIKNFGSSLQKYEKKRKQTANLNAKNDPLKSIDNKTDDDEVIKIETGLVLHDLLVSDRAGNVVTQLKGSDFLLLEDQVPQSIEVFAASENSRIPRSIVLVIDTSLLQFPFLKMSTDAAKTLVDKLRPDDEMAIVTADLILHSDFTADKTLLKATLNEVEKRGIEYASWYRRGARKDDQGYEHALNIGRGGQFETLLAVLNEMFDDKRKQRVIIFQGDGGHMIWLKPDKNLPYPVSHTTRMNSGMKYSGESAIKKFGFGEIEEAIEVSRVTIYSVILGIRFFGLPKRERANRARISWAKVNEAFGWKTDYPAEMTRMFEDREENVRTAGQAAMFKVAELSGGNTAVMEKPEDAGRIYADILGVIESRYVIGYYPTDGVPSERRRSVKVEVRGRPDYTVTTRSHYILK